ncbi:DUF2179 domain-containing protein [Cohnella endophytica]|uniref:UPF0316 protein D7Z26_20425 n=1 Tax=Cohnella endophytica TaxID=2419778 RepID=A0A494XD75_9BACL|nr:DUF2179 domain-containing protein [Cohnella endophytica]RKP48747.1 DUF2179 domain-containing protein [Cohnella endophytica]
MTVILSIIALQITYVSMLSVRFILMVKGVRYIASMMSAIEIGIYVVGFKLVLDNLDKPLNLFAYCLSYGVGVLIGVKLEERLAIGYITVQVTTDEQHEELSAVLRSKGYGVTSWSGEGKEGRRWVHNVVLARKRQQQLYSDVLAEDPNAFIVSYEPKGFHGGFLARRL